MQLLCWTQISVLYLLYSSVDSELETTEAATMKSSIQPVFRYPMSKFIIPTLEAMSIALAREVRGKLFRFASEFSNILIKHFTSETEVHIDKGCLTDDSHQTLQKLESEMAVLQYRSHLQCILGAWTTKLVGQPVYPEVHNLLFECVGDIFKEFENFIYELQVHVNKEMRAANAQLCLKACNSYSRIMNLTEVVIPHDLDIGLMRALP